MTAFDSEIFVGSIPIGEKHRPLIIAEGGVNHNGKVELGKRLIEAAKNAGAGAVKFQFFYPSELVQPTLRKAAYQMVDTGPGSQFEMLQSLFLEIGEIESLKNCARDLGLPFICTPFDFRSLDELLSMGVDAIKVASTDTTNIPFLRRTARAETPVILSTAMTNGGEIERAVQEFHGVKSAFVLLQCTGNYPAPPQESNISVVRAYKERFACLVGLSDHTIGSEAAALAIASGGRVIEKHLTLSKTLAGPDHKASADPAEFATLCVDIERVWQILGNPSKVLTPSEASNRKSMQKSIIAGRDLNAGERLSLADVKILRAGGEGISPIHWDDVVRMRIAKFVSAGSLISWGDLQW